MKNIEQHKKVTKEMALRLIQFENEYDDSMRGHFLEQLVGNYTEVKGLDAIAIYEQIMKEQIKDIDDYGDIDTSIHKLEIVGEMDNWKYYKGSKYTAEGIFVIDNPTTASINKWVIIKVIKDDSIVLQESDDEKFKERMKSVSYYFYYVNKEIIKKFDIAKLGTYNDVRDSEFIASFESSFGHELKLLDVRGSIGRYHWFDHLYSNLLSVRYELNANKENENKKIRKED